METKSKQYRMENENQNNVNEDQIIMYEKKENQSNIVLDNEYLNNIVFGNENQKHIVVKNILLENQRNIVWDNENKIMHFSHNMVITNSDFPVFLVEKYPRVASQCIISVTSEDLSKTNDIPLIRWFK
jgi:hypothetical protein